MGGKEGYVRFEETNFLILRGPEQPDVLFVSYVFRMCYLFESFCGLQHRQRAFPVGGLFAGLDRRPSQRWVRNRRRREDVECLMEMGKGLREVSSLWWLCLSAFCFVWVLGLSEVLVTVLEFA